MKQKIIITILLAISCVVAGDAYPAATAPTQQQTNATSTNSQWIETGEVTLYRYNCEWKRIQGAVLYAYCIGERMLYKVEYGSRMYSVSGISKNDFNYEMYSRFNAKVTIDEYIWYLNVPGW